MPIYEQHFNKFVDFMNQYEDKLNEFELKKLLPTYYFQEEVIHPFFSVSYEPRKKNLLILKKLTI